MLSDRLGIQREVERGDGGRGGGHRVAVGQLEAGADEGRDVLAALDRLVGHDDGIAAACVRDVDRVVARRRR